jgi:threonine dehydratase
MSVTLEDIEAAGLALAGEVLRTPLIEAPSLSRACGTEVLLKLECLQHTGSFKTRGAFIRLAALSDDERKRGVIAVSAGNHAQGVAWHAKRLGIPALIVMPHGTPFAKVSRTEALGAKVRIEGASLADSMAFAEKIAAEQRLVFIHPYDDPRIIAGQGTVGLEMLSERPDLEAIIVPIGGGGLISGTAIAAKSLKSSLKVYGVQSELYPSMLGHTCSTKPTLAEGIAVKHPGELTRRLVKEWVDEIFLASETSIESAVQMLAEEQKIVAEGAGAAPLAALLANRDKFAGKKVGLVISGGNIDSRLLASVLLRGLSREGRLARLRVELADLPGMLSKVAGLIGEGEGTIVEVQHQRLFHDIPAKMAELDVLVETIDPAHVGRIVAMLNAAGFPARVLGSTADAC